MAALASCVGVHAVIVSGRARIRQLARSSRFSAAQSTLGDGDAWRPSTEMVMATDAARVHRMWRRLEQGMEDLPGPHHDPPYPRRRVPPDGHGPQRRRDLVTTKSDAMMFQLLGFI